MQMIQIFGTWIGVSPITNLEIPAALEYLQSIPETASEPGTNGAVTQTQRLLDAPIFAQTKSELELLALEYVHTQGHSVTGVQRQQLG